MALYVQAEKKVKKNLFFFKGKMILKLVGHLEWLIYSDNRLIVKKHTMRHNAASVIWSMSISTRKYKLCSVLLEMYLFLTLK